MTTFFEASIEAVGSDVLDLLDGGVLILYPAETTAELAEFSVLQRCLRQTSRQAPSIGALLTIAGFSASLTAIGETAWEHLVEAGHVVINFSGSANPARPGDLCASPLDTKGLARALSVGQTIAIAGPP